MTESTLSTATIGDFSAIMNVMDSAFDPAFGEAWTRAQLLTLFALPSSQIRLAWHEGRVCGFSAIRIAGPESELLLLAVDPSARGHGLAKQLIEDWKSWAKSQGAEDLFLEMRADNEAVFLYNRCGFFECGRRNNYYKGADGKVRDAITMRFS